MGQTSAAAKRAATPSPVQAPLAALREASPRVQLNQTLSTNKFRQLPCRRERIEGRLCSMSGSSWFRSDRWFRSKRWSRSNGWRRGFIPGGLAWAALAMFTESAHAVPGETRAGLELGAGTSSRTPASPSLGVRGAYGLESNWELQLEATGVWLQHGVKPLVTQIVPALAYRFDVVRWVPFVRLGVGAAVDWHEPAIVGLGSGAAGMDYLWDRTLGFSLTYQADFWLLRPERTVPMVPLHRVMLGVTWSSGW